MTETAAWPPDAPDHLGDHGRAFWDRICAEYRLGAGELELLEVAAQSYARQRAWRQLRNLLEQDLVELAEPRT